MPEVKIDPVALKDVVDPHGAIWTDSLSFMEVDPDFVKSVAEYINKLTGLPTVSGDYGACHVNEVITSENTYRLFIDNEEYWYASPVIRTKRPIKSLYYVTKPECYPINRPDEHSFRIRVPGFGMDIVEVTYAD